MLELPTRSSRALCEPSRAVERSQALLHRQLERSYFAACDLLEATAGRFTLPQCVLAIEACGADKDRAVQWYWNGDISYQLPCVMAVAVYVPCAGCQLMRISSLWRELAHPWFVEPFWEY